MTMGPEGPTSASLVHDGQLAEGMASMLSLPPAMAMGFLPMLQLNVEYQA
jgi:hypothetical protein